MPPASRVHRSRATRRGAGTPDRTRSRRRARTDRSHAAQARMRIILPDDGYDLLVRVLLLVNAAASSVTARRRVMIRKLLAAEHDVEVAETSRRGHASRLAHAAANDGFDVVAVLAGDGTLNEAADGLLHGNTALAPLPGGSTNVYARTLGYPNDAVDAAHVLLASLARSATKRIGVGTANRRPFLFNTGIGFDAAVIRRVERYGELKRHFSHPLHVAAAFEVFFRKEGTHTRLDIELDTGEVNEGAR